MKVKSDHRSKFSNLSNWKWEAWKNQGFNGIWTRDLRDTDAMQLENLLRWSLFTFNVRIVRQTLEGRLKLFNKVLSKNQYGCRQRRRKSYE